MSKAQQIVTIELSSRTRKKSIDANIYRVPVEGRNWSDGKWTHHKNVTWSSVRRCLRAMHALGSIDF